MTCISLIVAVAHHGVIGLHNTLPWHLPEDLKRFRALTMGHHIIMGRKTHESLNRLLPGRTHVIVTRNTEYSVEGALVAHSLSEAIALCGDDSEVFIIGGAELYKDGLLLADKLHLTEIDASYEGDAFFPAIEQMAWTETDRETHTSINGLAYRYITYARNQQ